MSILDFLKNKKKAEKAKKVVKAKSDIRDKESKKTEEPIKESIKASFKNESAEGARVLKRPVITEKSTYLAENNKYVFEVFSSANKTEIKRAVEKLYDVKVDAVNLFNVLGKKRRVGRTMGRQSSFKKAVVSLPKGQKIDIMAQ